MLRITKLLFNQTIIEKIASCHNCVTGKYYAGDIIKIIPKYVMTHDNTYAIIKKFEKANLSKIHDHTQLKYIIDHDIQNKSKNNLDKYKYIENFAKKHNIEYFEPGFGIGHQVMCEQGFIEPNTMVVASDSHSNMYGGIGCLGTPIVRTDAAAIWATGNTWWKIPQTVKVVFKGKLQTGVYAKDIILTLINIYPTEVLNYAVEFEGYENLSIDDRLTIANMTTEWGAVAGIFPADKITIDWLLNNNNFLKRMENKYNKCAEYKLNYIYNDIFNTTMLNKSDYNARYCAIITLDLSTITPSITGPNDVSIKNYKSNSREVIPINKGFILSCVNGRLSDLKIASEIIGDKKLKVDLYIAASSLEIEQNAKDLGYWDIFEKAGVKFLPSGCGPCIGLGQGILEDNDTAISATNRNYKGRMGSRNAECYLASPSIVAKSCIDGFITLPEYKAIKTSFDMYDRFNTYNKSNKKYNNILSDIVSKLVIINKDNISTDLIYAGKYTYQELSFAEQAKVVFENYDPNWKTPEKFVLIAGFNFGCGSSREQAVTALQYRGCVAIIAGSFNDTYLRNAYNNGLICIVNPNLVNNINKIKSQDIRISFNASQIIIDKHIFKFDPISTFGQNILKAGGIKLENLMLTK